MNSDDVQERKLEVGKRYQVAIQDCCVSGTLEGVLQAYEEAADDPTFVVALKFDFGTLDVGSYFGYTFTEVPS